MGENPKKVEEQQKSGQMWKDYLCFLSMKKNTQKWLRIWIEGELPQKNLNT